MWGEGDEWGEKGTIIILPTIKINVFKSIKILKNCKKDSNK